ncbi:MAG: hypothetical protein KDB23_18225, partial [Planctomycetales bacterium]|nr:hypothetical protein [Planctomycetales bacterium]
ALKLRVTDGTLTTVLSPRGAQLTAVQIKVDVIQRSSLTVGLPAGGELFNLFVNGESVNVVRNNTDENEWQFYILPGIDDRTATVQFVYSAEGNRLGNVRLVGPELNVPLENIKWNVIAPNEYVLTQHDGNLELAGQHHTQNYDRASYLSKAQGKREEQAAKAAGLLQQANQLLQAGDQSKARWALSSVANQYALDAASNEDARVQLENLQTQQAIVGLNTRRQRLYLDNDAANAVAADNQQLREAAAVNPILQQDALNFRPQEISQLLGGNSSEENAILHQIAGRIVHHQRTSEPAPQSIGINLPEEGSVYNFRRSVQVSVDSPLELQLGFRSLRDPHPLRVAATIATLLAIGALIGFAFNCKQSV